MVTSFGGLDEQLHLRQVTQVSALVYSPDSFWRYSDKTTAQNECATERRAVTSGNAPKRRHNIFLQISASGNWHNFLWTFCARADDLFCGLEKLLHLRRVTQMFALVYRGGSRS
jgi:hypothetical protein